MSQLAGAACFGPREGVLSKARTPSGPLPQGTLSLGGFLFFVGRVVRFTKPALTIDQQVAHLQARGMAGDPSTMRRCLESVNYYRLSAYWHTFRKDGGELFLPGTAFEVVWGRYVFDRSLRLLVMDAIERFEVAVRTRLAYEHAQAGGAFGYSTDPSAVFAGRGTERARFFDQLDSAMRMNHHEPFVQHFREKYGEDHDQPPVWVAVEVLMFGDIVRLFRGSPHAIQRLVADFFGVSPKVMTSWLLTLNVIRNLCAHHGRLWNRELGHKPFIPRHPEWEQPIRVPPDRVFAVLTILADVMRRLAPADTWALRLRALLDASAHIPLQMMGFPRDWKDSLIWRNAWAGGMP